MIVYVTTPTGMEGEIRSGKGGGGWRGWGLYTVVVALAVVVANGDKVQEVVIYIGG